MKNVFAAIILAVSLTQMSLAEENTMSMPMPQQVNVSVTEKGFEPSVLQVDAGRDVLLTVTRKTDTTCAKSVVIPKLKLKESLPLNKPVTLKLAKLEKGEIKFSCGMGMMGGVINAR